MENILQKIQDLYNNDKSHGFIIHLIHAYIPVGSKASKILDDGNYSCCITHDKLLTFRDTFELLTQTVPMSESIKGLIDSEAKARNIAAIKAKQGNPKIGYVGQSTDKYLSQDALEALNDFVLNELMRDNREIGGIIHKMRKMEINNG